jgi:hypothetical protein
MSSMIEGSITPAQRVFTPAQPDLDYRERIVHSTVDDHGAGVEAVIADAIQKRRALNDVLVEFLRPTRTKRDGSHPNDRRKSAAWREANAEYNGVHEALAALLGIVYSDGTDRPRRALNEAHALVEHRVGPLCNGYTPRPGAPVEHLPDVDCPLHTDTPTT